MKIALLFRSALAAAAVAFAGLAWAAAFDPNPNDRVDTILPLPDGDILVAGQFSRIAGAQRTYFARLNQDGTFDANLVDVDQAVNSIVAQADGKIVIGGGFSQVGGAARAYLARINADGSLDTAFAATSIDGNVRQVLVQPNGRIIILGDFTAVGGATQHGIARLNADGSPDQSFSFDAVDESAYLTASAVQADGKILVGGLFTINGTVCYFLRLNPDGSLDTGFPLDITNRAVTEILVQSDGAVLIAGDFTEPARHLARLQTNGAPDTSFDAASRLRLAEIRGMAQQGDGKLLIAGANNYVPANSPPAIVRLNLDGTFDAGFADPKVTEYSLLHSLAVQADGKVLIGGYFHGVDGYVRNFLARLNANGTLDIPHYAATPAPGPHGTFSPATPQDVRDGDVARFTIQPDAGYHLNSITGCGGAMQGAEYVTSPVTANCAIVATFAAPELAFAVATDVRNGTSSPQGTQTVRFGQPASFTLTANPGYYLSTVSGCGGSLNGDVYTIAPASADCTVSAVFVEPSRLLVTAGSQQAAAANAPFGVPLTVRVTSATMFDGRPVAGVEVRFDAPANGASALLSSPVAITDANGEASVIAIANGIDGGYAVKASVPALPTQPGYFTLSNEALGGAGIDLRVTLGTDRPPACGATDTLDVAAGTPVNYCFTVTNRSAVAMNYHSLSRWPLYYFWALDHNQALYLKQATIAPGATYRYNQVIAAGADDTDQRFTWSAIAETPRYTVNAAAAEPFVDISTSGTQLTFDDGVAAVALPFEWNYYGMRYSTQTGYHLCVHNSGNFALGFSTNASYCRAEFNDDNRPTDGDYVNGILPYWDALGSNGEVYLQTVGTAPNRRLIVQWNNKDHASQPNPSGGVTFEAIVDEAGGKITFVYRDVNFDVPAAPGLDNGGSATVGIIGNTGSLTARYAPALHDGQSISFTPTPSTHVASAVAHVHAGTPRIQVTPASISAGTPAGTTATRTLDIVNTGNLALDWSVARAASTAHFPATERWLLPVTAAKSPWVSQMMDMAALPASNDAVAGGTMFAVPAYGAKQENTEGPTGNNNFVGFDAADPDVFVPVPTVAYNVLSGDFVGDDFSKEYVIYRDTDTLVSSIAIADLVDGGIFPIADLPQIDERWSGMAWDRTTNVLFVASVSTGNSGEPCNAETTSGHSTLHTVDRANGEVHDVGEIAFADSHPLCVTDIAVSPAGLMYGIDLLNDALLAIDKNTGRAVVIGSLGVDLKEVNSIDFDDVSGTLYLSAMHQAYFIAPDSGGIYTIDLVTGLARRLARYPLSHDNLGYFQLDALAIARAGGHCAYPGEIAWLRSGTAGGTTAPGQHSPVMLTLDATGLTAGRYAANVCVSSNDLSRSLVGVPIDFTVTPGGDTIFRNGFEGVSR